MKRFLTVIAAAALVAGLLWAGGTGGESRSTLGNVLKVTYSCTNAGATTLCLTNDYLNGAIYRVVWEPTASGANQVTGESTVTIDDEYGFDMLQGLASGLASNANATIVPTNINLAVIADDPVVTVTSAGTSATYNIHLYVPATP